jgi:hypothetical protein
MQAARRLPRSVAVDEIKQEVGLPPVTAARRAFFLTRSITERDTANRHPIPAVGSVWRECPGVRRAKWLPMLRTSNPAASG